MRKKLRDLTRRIEMLRKHLHSMQAYRKEVKKETWDEWCGCDNVEFYKRKRTQLEDLKFNIKTYQEELTDAHRLFRMFKLRYDELLEEKRHLEKHLADGYGDAGLIKERLKIIERYFGS